jgi:RNA polymerase sigma-70 factor (ECF subfamily)
VSDLETIVSPPAVQENDPSPFSQEGDGGDGGADIEASLEQALLKKAQQGDRDAYEQLHLRLEPPIRRFIRRLIGNTEDCDDLVQETFISLYLNLHRIDPLSQLRAYTYQIARNACYSRLRRLKRRDEVSIEEDEESPSGPRLSFDLRDTGEAPEDVAHWLLLKLEVDEAIDRLPAAQREVLLLYTEAELTYAEIAQALDISIGTVKSRIFHAKRTLRGLVKPHVLLAIQSETGDQDAQEDGEETHSQADANQGNKNQLNQANQSGQASQHRAVGEL